VSSESKSPPQLQLGVVLAQFLSSWAQRRISTLALALAFPAPHRHSL